MNKTLGTRIKECIEIRGKMKKFGLDELEELTPFVEDMNVYVKDGRRRTGTIKVISIGRIFEYFLEDKEGCESVVSLKKEPGVTNEAVPSIPNA
jgi:hypothetical protein